MSFRQLFCGRTFWSLFLLMMMCGACQKDDIRDIAETEKSMTIRVLLPDPVVTAPMTRAGATDFDRITDLNVVVADKSGTIEHRYYYNGNNEGTADPTYSTIGGVLEVHFSKDYVQTNDLASKSIFLVANYGKDLNTESLDNVSELRALKQSSSDTPGVPNGCMMFAEAVDKGGSHTHTDTGDTGKRLEANLVRTVAMVTVKIDGSGLNKNIMITPTAISLHRVPTDCYIGNPNNDVTAGENGRIAETGEFKDGLQYSWDPIVGTATQTGGYSEWRSHGTVTGGHYSEENYADQSIAPLFLFENLHGKDFGEPLTEDHQGGKRPAGTENKPDKIDEATKNCSYLQVDANYMKVDDDGNPQFSGKVSFRFFLGHDEYKDFDVTRNHYYQVTLAISGNGVTEGGQVGTDADGNTILEVNDENVTWRVDSDLSTASFLTGDVNLNASGEYFYVHVAADPGVTWTVTGSGDQFVWCYGSIGGWTDWGSVAEGTTIKPIDNSGTLLFYCEPWMYQEGETVSQSMTLTLTPSPGSPTSITITRYSPLRITLSATEYPYIQEIFGKSSVDFLMDRIDRESLPWGFYGEVLDKNHADGFDNTFHLIDETPDCGNDHRTTATKYLPFGTADKIDPAKGGSAMIYALMLYSNQNTTASGDPATNVLVQDFPVIDRNHDWNNTKYYWTIPSIEEWQIIEKAARDKGILDTDFPILDWFKYWTSDAVTRLSEPKGGYTHAFTYQFNQGLDALIEGDEYPIEQRALRTERLRFRLISVAPDNLPPAN